MQWWEKQFKQTYAYATSDASSSDSSSESNPSQVSSAIHDRTIVRESRRPSLSQSTRHGRQSRTQEDVRTTFGPDTSFRRPLGSRKDSENRVIDDPESNLLNSTSSSRYQVWYPPTAKPTDEDGGSGPLRPLALAVNVTEEVTTVAHQQVDEWRQYPAFPSAYPPTPIAVTSKVPPTMSPSRFSPIEEEPYRQGFQKSLLPPRGPLDPSRACDLSDKTTFGISPFLSSQPHDADGSTSTDDYENEDEDDFNTTLKTPLQPQGSAKSRPHLHLFVAPRSVSNSSVLSRSSAFTTLDNGSPLRTASSEPSPSGLPFRPLPPAVVRKKRSYPHSQLLSSRNRVREVEEDSLDQDSDIQPTSTEKFTRSSQKSSPSLQSTVGISDVVDSTSNSGGSDTNDRERIPPEKRRRVVRSPSARAIKPRRLGNRTSNYSSPTRVRSRGTFAHLSQSPVVTPKRRSRRLKAAKIRALSPEPLSPSISEADKETSDSPTKMTLRSRSKK